MSNKGELELEKNPTPKGEQKEFDNSDDTRRREEHAHKLALLSANQGRLGSLIGSSDSNLTIAFCIIVIAGVCVAGSLIGMIWQPQIFLEAVKFLGTVILTVAGYVFGVKSTNSE